MLRFLLALVLACCNWGMVSANDPGGALLNGISGDYLEVRNSDVWTGPCFANGEVNLTGREAIMAWSVREGSWNGVRLDGLKVVAAVHANATLGDPFADQRPAKAALIVDKRATKEQSEALADLARSMGGALLENIVWVKKAKIDLEMQENSVVYHLRAGDIAEVRTRTLGHHDMHCGNETIYYPPLADVRGAKPAFAMTNSFAAEGLGTTWSWPGKRSAFVASFVR